jgi:hypothetical protein
MGSEMLTEIWLVALEESDEVRLYNWKLRLAYKEKEESKELRLDLHGLFLGIVVFAQTM